LRGTRKKTKSTGSRPIGPTDAIKMTTIQNYCHRALSILKNEDERRKEKKVFFISGKSQYCSNTDVLIHLVSQ
jgi:hypothetical protein